MVVGSQQEQIPVRVPVIPGDLRHGHLVQGHRDRAHAVLRGHLPQQAAEFVGPHGLVPQDLHELVQNGAEDLPQLGSLLRLLEPACLCLGAHLFLQGALEVETLQKVVKCIYFLTDSFSGFQAFIQSCQGLPHPAAQAVHLLQPGLPPVVPGGAVAVGVVGPVHVPQPHLPVDLPGEDIVFQQVALLRRQSRQAGLQPTEHVLVLKAVLQGGEDAGDEAPHGLFQHVAAAAQVGGDLIPLEHRLDDALVVRHVPGGHGNVPVAALSRRHQVSDIRRRLLHLGEGGVRLPDADGTAVPFVGFPLSEEVPLQMAQSRVVGTGQRPDLPGTARLLRQPRQLVPGAEGDLEHLLGAVRLPQQRDGDGPGLPRYGLQHLPLLGVEVGEAVQKHVLAEDVAGGSQRLAEPGHPVPGVKAGTVQPGLIRPVQQAQIQQLVPAGPLDLPGLALQQRRGHAVAAQLVKEVQQLLQKRRLLGGAAVDLQQRSHLPQGLLQRQQLAAGVQRHLGGAAGQGQHPVTQTAEAEDLRMAAGGIPAEAAQVHLRLVGGMLRHQQDLLAGIPQFPDLAEHLFRFSRFGPAHQDRQHGGTSFARFQKSL